MNLPSNNNMESIGFGGGCHWCTEAIFQSIRGVVKVDQGWISAIPPNEAYAEAVLVHYDPKLISMEVLISIHLNSHSSTSNHPMRKKYRSAVYVKDDSGKGKVRKAIAHEQEKIELPIITEVLDLKSFKLNQEKYLDYYIKNPESQFCRSYISPKLSNLRRNYSRYFST